MAESQAAVRGLGARPINGVVSRSNRRRALRRFVRNRAAVAGLALLVISLLVVAFGPLVYTQDPYSQDLRQVLDPPSWRHPLGTDWLGRDILSRVIHGGRVSMTLGLVVVVISMLVGTAIGTVAGYLGGWYDEIALRVTDIFMAFPGFLLALLLISILGPGLYQAMIAVGLSYVPRFVRLSRASTLSVKQSEYVQAARVIGQRSPKILVRHVLPNIMGPIIVQATLLIGLAILIAASLGFLGLGVQPPAAEWGNMLSDGRNYLVVAPHVVLYPGLAILLVVLAFNLIGDGLRDALDVKVT